MKIDFSFVTEYGIYNDCLNLPDDHNFSEIELEEMKIQRKDAWVRIIQDAINNPPVLEVASDNSVVDATANIIDPSING